MNSRRRKSATFRNNPETNADGKADRQFRRSKATLRRRGSEGGFFSLAGDLNFVGTSMVALLQPLSSVEMQGRQAEGAMGDRRYFYD
jgi:hypothetical protein